MEPTDPDPDPQHWNKVFQRMLSCECYNIDKYKFHFTPSDKYEFDFHLAISMSLIFFIYSADHIQKKQIFLSVLTCVTFLNANSSYCTMTSLSPL